MMKTLISSLLLASSAVLSACSSTPLAAPAVELASACPNCGTRPYYAYAVTRPPICNDYPVTYRVQIPETDERVRAVDRSALYSREGAPTVYGACPR